MRLIGVTNLSILPDAPTILCQARPFNIGSVRFGTYYALVRLLTVHIVTQIPLCFHRFQWCAIHHVLRHHQSRLELFSARLLGDETESYEACTESPVVSSYTLDTSQSRRTQYARKKTILHSA